MIFKRIRYKAIPEEAQNNWEVLDEMVKNAKKYFKKYVSDKELNIIITLNSPVPTNLPKAKTLGDYFVVLKKKEITLNDTFKKLQTKILTIMEQLRKVWYTLDKPLVGGPKKFNIDGMSQYIDQTVLLIGQAYNSVSYSS